MKNIKSRIKYFSSGLIIALMTIVAGCRSHQDMTYLNELNNERGGLEVFTPLNAYRIKTFDNLFVSVVSGNTELDELYNPMLVGNGRSNNQNNMWGTQASQFVNGYLVNDQGEIVLPTFGPIKVSSLTLDECEERIRNHAMQFLKDATVKVRLLNYRVTIIGEVQSPGVYYSYNPSINIFDAIGLGGGSKNTADLSKVLLVREKEKSVETYRLNLNSAEVLSSPGFKIYPNDVVIVQPARLKNAELRQPVFSLIFSSVTTFLLMLNFLVSP
jgi:polysaccharide export outer membrane protein